MTTSDWDIDRARTRIEALKALPGALLPMLHALQDEFGYVPDKAIPLLMDALNQSRAEIVGVIHFYHDFRTEPGGRHLLQVCRAESCQAMGSDALLDHVRGRLAVDVGGTTPDGAISLDAVYCLGNCALSPAVMLDGRIYGRVSNRTADRLIEAST